MKIDWGWEPGVPGKGLLFEDEGELRLLLWPVDEEGNPHHIKAALQLELSGDLERIKAYLDLDHSGAFFAGRGGPGFDDERIEAEVKRLDPRLGPLKRLEFEWSVENSEHGSSQ